MKSKINPRRNFGKEDENLPKLDLTLIQRESWQWFLVNGIAEELKAISPIDDFTGKNWQLSLGDHSLGLPSITASHAQLKGSTYSSPLKITANLINKRTGKEVSQEVFLGDLPQMTHRGTFIINGIERAVINQIVRSPGIYFSGELDPSSGRVLYKAEVRPLHGSWLEFEVTRGDLIYARIDRRKKVLATVFLKALGLENEKEIIRLFSEIDSDKEHKYIEKTLEKDSTKGREEALLEIYRKLRPGEPVLVENAVNLFESLFLDKRRYDLGEVGRHKINKRLGSIIAEKNVNVLTLKDVTSSLNYLVGLQNGKGRVDDIDHLSNRRLRRVGELVAVNAFRIGLLRLERSVKEKMSLISPDDRPLPSNLINARPLISSLNEFFRSNQLSTILDDTNPLSEVDNLRRVSVLGAGGINRERASFSIRDVNSSQYGRLDPVRSPEGPNIGLVTYLSLYARVNEFGFLETPYKKIEKVGKKVRVTDEITYLTADDEENYHITHSGISIDDKGFIKDERVPLRYLGNFTEGLSTLVDLIDITPRQLVGTSASLIPFLAHDEGNRALMGSNMQCQAVPLVAPEAPIVGTGMEGEISQAMKRAVVARHSGIVEYTDNEKVVIKLDKKISIDESAEDVDVIDGGNKESYSLMKFKRTAHSTCYNQRIIVSPGEKIKEGDLLVDGPASQNGELALGRNLVVAYTSFGGYGFEDAILISDRLVKEDLLTSIHIEEYDAEVVDTKLGAEERTRDIPNVSEAELANLAEDGIVVIGAEVGPNDILVGKIAPKGETELTSEERLLRAIFGEKAREVRDTSLRVPHGEKGIVVGVNILDRNKGDDLGPGVIEKITVKVAQIRKITVGDKVAGRHGNKGVISKIMSVSDMPYLSDGTPVDIVISPLSVLSRMNLGQLLEAHFGLALHKMNEKGAFPVFDHITEDTLVKELKNANLSVTGKTRLTDGRTGESFKEDTVVGIGYILKLTHMVEDKTHARSTGPYSLVTQQPLGGKAQMGGQRLGEMEVWALEAHRAQHILQEMLTIKSDDIVGRAKAFEAIVKNTDIPESTIPESFKVLVRELNALGLNIIPKGVTLTKDIIDEDTKAGEELAKNLGAEVIATEELVDPKGIMEVVNVN
ncbi:DNA-directed RNA polymerase subunit beta [Candidatus Woesebacteria bacterium RIFOXYC1_FULL_31_51]|uniref:DNA-directed RNA polymerase subunit beta n=1 Tax=Candidatus Woesebacteria bacterium GW2011_GWC2_31_9 TaxID=1618586 RepID=A0A0F9YXT2_9BACT|nr:MAG: DNA-directed RNA polymerase subunit beta, DNA-directed RNA polymerase subunit beta [Candidatus Woesebacteria bacterium GW2011_GWF1_31_35]KKP23303.1 MAG: DNA-directed RNA polymerase subunit beta [Candidatus Woesebacteria bacterium GW2011_GWC1_30_29]KKP26179.1 MAG: DNA-directed RNA polymerase subunit beta [Candidatus Woesebacteria bacterium GW2011_GWD1_31_12]KKP27564.1 MAG: DNA-directed RNA polymerase subunit beta [Candidatus Woesebacteria bacterium GW2011_GWB1_31_29]KKP31261.1 MAG: DNA-d